MKLVQNIARTVAKPIVCGITQLSRKASAFPCYDVSHIGQKYFTYDSSLGIRHMDLSSDYLFKRIFQVEARMKNFLEQVLIGEGKILPDNMEIKELSYLPNEYQQDLSPKYGREIAFDLQVKTAHGIFIVEMQKDVRPEYLSRVEFYNAAAYYSQPIQMGQQSKMKAYANAFPIVTISFMGESSKRVFDKEVPCISYHTNKEHVTGKQYMKAFSYVFIDLKKFNIENSTSMSRDLQEWLLLFKTHDLDYQYSNPQIQDSVKYVKHVRDNDYHQYFQSLLAQEIRETEKLDAKAEGKIEGKIEGKAEEKIKMIKNMLESRMDPGQISESAKTSLELVELIKGNPNIDASELLSSYDYLLGDVQDDAI